MDREKERQIVIEGRKQGKSDDFIKAAVLRYRQRNTQAIVPPVNTYQVDSPTANIPVIKQLSSVGVGIGSELGKAGLGLGQTLLKGAKGVGTLFGADTSGADKLITGAEKLKQNLYTKPFEKQLDTTSGKAGQFVGQVIPYVAPAGAVTRAQGAITGAVSKIPAVGNLAKFGKGALGVAGRAVPEAVSAGLVGLGVSGGDLERAKRDAMLGAGASVVLGGAGSLLRGARQSGSAKTVLSATSGIPKAAFDALDSTGKIKGATPETALAKGRQAVVSLRAKNTKLYQDALPKIEEAYRGIVHKLSSDQITRFATIADEFSIDPNLLPQNLNKMTSIESLNIIKALNELKGPAVLLSPRGAIVRQLKKELRPQIVKTFGGDKGKIANLLSTYSTKMTILDNMNDVVNAYKTTPRATVTAKNRLMAIFDENKPEFLKAVKDIEKELGVNILGDVASTKFQNILPVGTLKADGGLPTKASLIDKVFKAFLLPVTSPRFVGKIALPARKKASAIEKRLFGDSQEANQRNKAIDQDIIINTVKSPRTNKPIDIKNTISKVSSIPETKASKVTNSPETIIKNIQEKNLQKSKQKGAIRIGNKTVKEIDEPTKQELFESIKLLQGKASKIDEKGFERLAEKFDLNVNGSVQSLIKRIETILENTKTKTVLPKSKVNESVSSLNDSTLLKEAKNYKKPTLPNKQGGFISTGFVPANLSTKILKDLKGKGTVSKQFISDLTNKGDIKQVEKDLIRDVLSRFDDGKIDATEFGKAVEAELLPLKRVPEGSKKNYARVPQYESISLPDDLRGNVKNYSENLYESPIKTSAGGAHFNENVYPNYFGHTRIEDMADNKTRRVIEVQSDLFQKGNLEKEMTAGMAATSDKEIAAALPKNLADEFNQILKDRKAGIKKEGQVARLGELNDMATEARGKVAKGKLTQYNNPTAHFRMLREEVQKAAQDGKTKLQVPTGETAMKIEGLGNATEFNISRTGRNATPETLKIGEEVISGNTSEPWIITDVLEDGKFKAVPKKKFEENLRFALRSLDGEKRFHATKRYEEIVEQGRPPTKKELDDLLDTQVDTEQFDISGKVDTNNPIYRFYEKDMGRYLKNKYNAKLVTDNKGVSWYELDIKPEYKTEPVEAFGKIGMNPLFIGAGVMGGAAVGSKVYADKKKTSLPKPR